MSMIIDNDEDDDDTTLSMGSTGSPPIHSGSSNSVEYSLYCNKLLKEKVELPNCWSSKDKSNLLDLSQDSLRITYKNSKNDNEAALIRSNVHVPISCGIFYFEITILNKGKDGYIGIGVCTAAMPHNRLPGWEKHSYGYHGDDGNLFRGSGQGKLYGPTFSTNDVVGCCINMVQNTILFTKNGSQLGEAASDIKGLTLYPCVGLRTIGESVQVNFGQKPFSFDIGQIIKEERDRFIKSMKLSNNNINNFISNGNINNNNNINNINNINNNNNNNNINGSDEDFNSTNLVLDYLIHHGYFETVRSFAKVTGNSGKNLDLQLDDIKNRQRISELLSKGEINQVINQLNQIYPEFLSKRRDILFKLQCQKFIEMIRDNAAIEDIMEFGKNELYSFSQSNESYGQQLQEIFSLIAYTDPVSSPLSYLLSVKRREPIINDLNTALLVYSNKPAIPVLEKLIRQCKVLIPELISHNASPSAGLIDIDQFIKVDTSE